ncbi:MAG: alpha/beta fold hydrolase [Actinomycetes bacterium]
MAGLFIPGWGAHAGLYRAALPRGWQALEPPTFRTTRGSFAAYRVWLADMLAEHPGAIDLGGHSFGAALAVLAAHDSPASVRRLVLVEPAGLPLDKPMPRSMLDFALQAFGGAYPSREAARATMSVLAAPRAALRLARTVRMLNLRDEFEQLRARELPCTVVGARSDTLTPTGHCRSIAELLGADYRELTVDGGHMWFLGAAALHRRQFAPSS